MGVTHSLCVLTCAIGANPNCKTMPITVFPDFTKMNSLLYLVKLYHDITWRAADVDLTFSQWLRKALPASVEPTERDLENPAENGGCAVYVCDAHRTSPDAPRCSEYVCNTHRDPGDGAAYPGELLYATTDITAIPGDLRESFLSRADEYYAFLIHCVLNNILPTTIHWSAGGNCLIVRTEV